MFKILAATLPPVCIHFMGLVGLLGACARHEQSTPVSPSLTSATKGAVTGDAVVSELTNAWCNRAERCTMIGPGKKYVDRATCVRETSQQTASDFRAAECKGVGNTALRECANDVEKLGCSLDRDTVMMVTSCKSEELCR
ncbi:MAG: DUF6184 family natural product biosynthesis lipoprotein [Polyangiaceae bacterium]